MKRMLSIILALMMVLSLCACGKKEEPAPVPETEVVEEETEPVVVPTSVIDDSIFEEALTEEPAEAAVDWTHTNPLTGEPVEEDISKNRPVMVMLNNIKQALPQSGNGQADLIYEILEEGGITRMLAVYQDINKIEGNLGTIRSTRPYYVDLVAGMDGILVHAGGSGAAYDLIEELGVTEVDALARLGGGGAHLFWRDKGRLSRGVATEHTMYITASDLANWLPTSVLRLTHGDGFATKNTFVQDATPSDGSVANVITVPFSGYKTGEFKYDEATGEYLVSEYGAAYMDDNDKKQVSVKNVLIVMTEVKPIEGDSKNRISVAMSGSGIGYFAFGGKYVPINWSRASDTSMYEFTTMDGQPLKLGVGTSYVNIVPTTCSVSFVG